MASCRNPVSCVSLICWGKDVALMVPFHVGMIGLSWLKLFSSSMPFPRSPLMAGRHMYSIG